MNQFLMVLCVLAVCTNAAAQQPAQVQPEITRMALMIDGKSVQVLAHVYKPPGDGPFPIVIHSHGRAGTAIERANLKFPVPVGHGNYWLRKGVALVAPVRPGYGETGGADVEDSGSRWRGGHCYTSPNFTRTAQNASRTVVATYEWALRQPWVRQDRILVQGQSVGGMTSVAVAALNLPGVLGTVNFAGGSGGNPQDSPGKSCAPENLADTYRQFGRQARHPSLWLYASNDLYWGPDSPRTWHEAYSSGGSDTAFIDTGPVPDADGHLLLLRGGRMWSVPLDAFIRKVGLTAP